MTITTRYHTLSLPLPSEQRPTLLVAHSVVLRDRSLMIWCGGAEELQGHLQSQSRIAAGAKAEQSGTSSSLASSSSLLVEQVIAPPAQHQEPEEVAPSGLLTSEWAIAMADARAKTANATSLFRTNADLARPMAARLAKRHGASQLSLSLSLPPALLASGPRAQLAVEGALGDVLKDVFTHLQ